MEFKGTILRIGQTQDVSDKFRKRTFVVSDKESQYPQVIEFQCAQDRCGLLDDFQIEDIVTVQFNLRGKEWANNQGKVLVFNTLEVWKIEMSHKPANKDAIDDLPF